MREGASLNDAAAHRAAFALDEPPGCPVAKRNFRDEGDTPKDALSCARATACIDQLRIGAQAHADAADAVPDPGAIAAFVDLIHLDALLEVEACFLKSSVTAIEQPTEPRQLQHDDALAEARWRAGVVGPYRERMAKLQSVIADTNDSDASHAVTRPTRMVPVDAEDLPYDLPSGPRL